MYRLKSVVSFLTLGIATTFLPACADNFTTVVVQGAGANWNATIWDPGAVAPKAGNTYEMIDNGTVFGSAQNNTRVRNPATAGIQTFPGDVLIMHTNTEIRAKQAGAILNFPGVNGNPGLVLMGGVLNAGDDAVFTITGRVQVASQSYIIPADNGGGALKPLRGFTLAAQLSGSAPLVIMQAATNLAQEVTGNQNSFSGGWIVKAGLLKSSGLNSLGTGDIVIDPNYDIEDFPTMAPEPGPAVLQITNSLVSPGKLTLVNGGQLLLQTNATFAGVSIEGTDLPAGTHTFDELLANYPGNIIDGGSGVLTIQTPGGPASAPANLTAVTGNAAATLTWSPVALATGYLVSSGTSANGPFAVAGNSDGTTFSSTNLLNGQTYYFVVAATNGFGSSTNSAPVTVRPNVPVLGVTATADTGKITVTWTTLAGASAYSVFRSTDLNGTYTAVATNVSGTTYADTTVHTGGRYYYEVSGTLAGGFESSLSAAANVLTAPGAPVVSVSRFAGTVQTLAITTADPLVSDYTV